MPPPRKAVTVEELEAEELQSSPSREAVDVEDVAESTSKARRDRSGRRNEEPERSGRHKHMVSKTKGLPPGWVRKESKSKPGVYYYAHPATNHTQTELPMDIYAGLEAAAGASVKPAHTSNGKILGPPSASPVDKLKMVAEEAETKQKEAEEAKKLAQERALRKKREFDHTLKRVQAEEAAEEAGQEEELRKVRARRQEKLVESAKAAELEPPEDEEGGRKEMLRARLNEARVDRERGRKRPAGLCFGQSVPEAREKSPEPPPPKKEPSKKELKEMKKRKVAEKLNAKEAKKLKKKKDKERKEKKQLKKAEKKVRKSAKLLKKVKAGRFSSVSSSASSSSSSSGS